MTGFKNLSVASIITAVILLVIAFNVLATGLPLVNTASANLSATGLPLASFFASNGIVMLAIMGAVVLAVIGAIGLTKKGR